MLLGPAYFPHLRDAEEKALADALERRRIALERQPSPSRSRLLRLPWRSPAIVSETPDEAGPALPPAAACSAP